LQLDIGFKFKHSSLLFIVPVCLGTFQNKDKPLSTANVIASLLQGLTTFLYMIFCLHWPTCVHNLWVWCCFIPFGILTRMV